eukprot:1484285-Rhodomonas_salina.1
MEIERMGEGAGREGGREGRRKRQISWIDGETQRHVSDWERGSGRDEPASETVTLQSRHDLGVNWSEEGGQ